MISVGVWICGRTSFADPAVTLESLLREMTSRDALARLSDPPFIQKQASSWDRKQTGGRETPEWFANRDHDQFIRVEEKDGRKEFVLLEDEGPGCLTRWWAPLLRDCTGQVVRIYLDGESAPAIEENYHRFLSGQSFVRAPLAARGPDEANLYFPIPFARSCKITLGDPRTFYYVINYRAYSAGTDVRTFSRDQVQAASNLVAATGRRLESVGGAAPGKDLSVDDPVAPGGAVRLELPAGPSAIIGLSLKTDPALSHEALRSLVLTARFDGEDTIWCPVSEFFGSGVYVRPVRDWNRSVSEDGTFTASWVMPYARSAEVQLINLGNKAADVRMTVRVGAWQWDKRSLHFHASWRGEWLKAPPRFRDWTYVSLEGDGTYVGDTLTVYSPHRAWWGEGDERIYVDGETEPSHRGTGTEDYYGHAWGMRDRVSTPFLSAPARDAQGNDWRGYTTVSRMRLLDAIPFRRSLTVDMEVWSWQKDYVLHYAVGTFWYARPGSVCRVKPDPAGARLPLPRKAESVPRPPAVPGAFEGESLQVAEHSGGVVDRQNIDKYGWSRHSQLWWRDGKPGDTLTLVFEKKREETCKLVLHVTKAVDYGIFEVSVNGQAIGEPFDLYNKGVVTALIERGPIRTLSGENRLTFTIRGAHPDAVKRYMLGLDCFELVAP